MLEKVLSVSPLEIEARLQGYSEYIALLKKPFMEMSRRLDNLDPREGADDRPANPKLSKETSEDYHDKVRSA